jgi:uncharacterized protein (TIGR02231 family)
MKRLLLTLGALLAATVASAAPVPVPVDSTIAAVTVYTDRAVVTRTATVELGTGTVELVFANLPQLLDERSLQVSGKGTAQALILDVSARQTYVDFTPNARVKELEDQLQALGRQVRDVDDRGTVLQAQSAMLDRMEAALFAPPAKDVPRPELAQFTDAMTYLTAQKTKLTAERTALDGQREELQNKINTVQAQLNELRGAGGRAYKTVTVRVAAEQAGNLEVALAYTVPGASWAPSYDARVLAGERAVALGYFGVVRQNTGEDWKNVALTLSTARPGLGGAAPVLGAWNVDVLDLRQFEPQAERAKVFELTAGAASHKARGIGSIALAADEFVTGTAQATLEAGATSASFKIGVAATIPSDNSAQKVPVTSARLTTQPEYATVPKQLTTAYLTAKVFNNSEFPLLAGPMNVFLDGTFVATSQLGTVMAGEKFDLALGADEGISVKHKRVQKFTEETGLMSKSTRITYEYLLTIQNNKRTTERVVVTDQVPVSRNELIIVKVLAPDAKTAAPDAEGLLKWTLDLKPAEKRELTVKFTVEYPNGTNVTGLE